MPKQVLEQIAAFHEAAVWGTSSTARGSSFSESPGAGRIHRHERLFAGALVAALVPWSPLPKAALVVVAAVLVSTTAWAVSHPRTAP